MYLEVSMLVRKLMKIQDGLVDLTLELLSFFHALKSRAPVIFGWLLQVSQHNSTSSLVLILHELLCVFKLLLSRFLEKFSHSRECHVMPVVVSRLSEKQIGVKLSLISKKILNLPWISKCTWRTALC